MGKVVHYTELKGNKVSCPIVVLKKETNMAKFTVSSPEGDKVYEIEQDIITIGRSPANSIVIDDAASSRKHCIVKREEGKYKIIDMGSANGTKVNSVRINEKFLSNGDKIKIGKTIIIFDL